MAARLIPARWERRRWLGALLLDHLFASFVAVWLSVAVIGAVGLLARRQVAH